MGVESKFEEGESNCAHLLGHTVQQKYNKIERRKKGENQNKINNK